MLLVFIQVNLSIAVSGPSTSAEYLPIHLADAEGYFRREGLEVSLTTTRAEPGAADALARGRAELAATSLDAALRFGAVAGRPPRLVFGLTAAPPVALLAPANERDTIRRSEDLIGRTIGVSSPGAPAQRLLLALLERHGISPAQLRLVSLGHRPLVAALAAGKVHAGLVADPWASRLVEEGRMAVVADFRRRDIAASWLGGATVHAGLFVRPGTRLTAIQLTALARALLQATRRLQTASPEELRARLPDRAVGLRQDFATRVKGARHIYLPDGWVEVEALRLSLELVRSRGPLPRGVRVPRRPADLLLVEALKRLRDSKARPTP